MAKVYSIDEIVPVIDPSAFVHPEAVLIGDVIVGPDCYIGPCACLRGDLGRIRLEQGSNIQDTCVVHSFPEKDVIIEPDVIVGHGAVVHGCVIKRNVLIGINAVIMDNVVIGENVLIAAGALVPAGMQIPPDSLVAGIPARVVRKLTETELDWKSEGVDVYQRLAVRSKNSMKRVAPLSSEEQDRGRVAASRTDSVPLDEMKLSG